MYFMPYECFIGIKKPSQDAAGIEALHRSNSTSVRVRWYSGLSTAVLRTEYGCNLSKSTGVILVRVLGQHRDYYIIHLSFINQVFFIISRIYVYFHLKLSLLLMKAALFCN